MPYWRLCDATLRIRLPTVIELNLTIKKTVSTPCDALCLRLQKIAKVTQNLISTMQLSIAEMSQRIYSPLPDISEAPSERNDNHELCFNSWSKYHNTCSAQVAEGLLDEMKKTIADVKVLADTVLADATKVRSSMAKFTQVTSQRLNGMHAILSEQQKSVSGIAKVIKLMSRTHLCGLAQCHSHLTSWPGLFRYMTPFMNWKLRFSR